jgi:cation diffusion facilitator family transporter
MTRVNGVDTKRQKSRAALVAVLGGVLVLSLKLLGAALTGSVGVLSDALESIVNVAAAAFTAWAVAFASRPPDESHPYGHDKAEYLSSTLEALLIGVAGALTISAALERLQSPRVLEFVPIGFAVTIVASIVNVFLGRYLVGVGKRLESSALEADGRHVLSDVYTSAGVIAGAGLAVVTGVPWLDPLLALGVSGLLILTAFRLLRNSVSALLDPALSTEDMHRLSTALERQRASFLEIHDLRTRQAGSRRFVDFHLILPAGLSVGEAHARCDALEDAILEVLPGCSVTIHVEPEAFKQGVPDVRF